MNPIIQPIPIGGNYIDRQSEYTAALERSDELKQQLHAAQVAGNQDERKRSRKTCTSPIECAANNASSK